MASLSSLAVAALAWTLAPLFASFGPHAVGASPARTQAEAGLQVAGAPLGTPQAHSATTPSGPSAAAAPLRGGVERIELQASDDKRTVVGSFWAPKSSGGAIAPGVVLVHQAGGSREDMTEVAVRLQKQGFAVLAIDLRGHGESVGADKPWSEQSEDEQTKSWTFALRDVKGAAAWLQKQHGIHSSNVSLLGDRAGCTLVVRHATRDENVRAIVLLDPPREQMGFNLAKDIETLAGLPTLIAASKDTQSNAQAIADESAKANDGLKYIEIAVFKGVSMTSEIDKNLPSQIAKFLADKTMPKKAK